MKVLMYLPSNLNVIKGTNLRFLNMARFLPFQGVEVHVAALEAPENERKFIFHKIEGESNVKSDLQFLKEVIKSISPDIIFGHTHNSLAVAASAGKLFSLPTIVDLHGDYTEELKERYRIWEAIQRIKLMWQQAWYKSNMKRCDAITVVCEPLKELYQKFATQIFVIPGGVDPSLFSPDVEPEMNLVQKAQGRVSIAYAGNFRSYQGVDLLMDAASELKKRKEPFHFTFIGDVDKFPEAGRKIENTLDRDDFTLTGEVDYYEMPRFISAADILVVPRPYSKLARLAFPSKLPEYISMGKPVIATDVGDHYKVVKNMETGLLIKPTKEELVKAILRLKDKALRERLGRNAREHAVTNFSWEVLSNRLREIFENITGK